MTDNERRFLQKSAEWRVLQSEFAGTSAPTRYWEAQQELIEAANAVVLEANNADLDTNSASELCQDDGWISWYGGEQPVPDGTPVDVRRRDGTEYENYIAESWPWYHHGGPSDIVAYRVIGYTPEPQPPAIPDGIPCWVTARDGERYLRVATGKPDRYYTYGYEKGWTESAAPGSMRPACFPEWDQLPEWVTYLELVTYCGAWEARLVGKNERPEPGSYYEERPR